MNLLKYIDRILYKNNGLEKKVNDINLLASFNVIFFCSKISFRINAADGVPLKNDNKKTFEELPVVLKTLLKMGLIILLITSNKFKLIINSFIINIKNKFGNTLVSHKLTASTTDVCNK